MILLPVEKEIASAQERSLRYNNDATNAADTSKEFGIVYQAWKPTLKENGTRNNNSQRGLFSGWGSRHHSKTNGTPAGTSAKKSFNSSGDLYNKIPLDRG